MKLDPSQDLAVDLACTAPFCILTGGPGCHRRGTLILRSDGHRVPVEQIQPGDQLAGYNGAVRTVLALNHGKGEMARIIPVKGDSFVVNLDHVLTVVHSRSGEVTDVTVRDFLGWNAKKQHHSKLFRQGFDFVGKKHEHVVSPYALGVLIGDGCLAARTSRISNPDPEIRDAMAAEAVRHGLRLTEAAPSSGCPLLTFCGTMGKANPLTMELRRLGLNCTSGEKHVPEQYLFGTPQDRAEMLAGLLDTDGHLTHSGTFDFISKSPKLSDDVVFLARSLGIAAYCTPSEKRCQTGAGGTYWRVSISGHCDRIPTRVARKKAPPRKQIKDALRTGFVVDLLPEPEDFYGFTLDGDGRYLMGDFTVTHNTGKTTCLRVALDRMEAAGERVLLASFTGKAAKRMVETTGRQATTIHRLLEWRGTFQRNERNPIDADVVVIDEVSMLDTPLACDLLKACSPKTRIVFVGDADQLESVGPGRVLADLVESGEVPVARLTTIHRAAQESWVCRNAPKILRREAVDLAQCDDFRFIECESATDCVPGVERVLLEFKGEAQVLSPQRTTACGVEALNKHLQQVLNPPSESKSEWKLGQGEHASIYRLRDRVIQTVNNYTLEVFNGEVGTVEGFEEDGKSMVVDFGDRKVRYSKEQAFSLDLAYALTVHKTQGSEFPWAVVVVHSAHTFMLTRQLLYTAITRAKRGVIIVGNRAGLRAAIEAKDPPKRNTKLVERMREKIHPEAAPSLAPPNDSPAASSPAPSASVPESIASAPAANSQDHIEQDIPW